MRIALRRVLNWGERKRVLSLYALDFSSWEFVPFNALPEISRYSFAFNVILFHEKMVTFIQTTN